MFFMFNLLLCLVDPGWNCDHLVVEVEQVTLLFKPSHAE